MAFFLPKSLSLRYFKKLGSSITFCCMDLSRERQIEGQRELERRKNTFKERQRMREREIGRRERLKEEKRMISVYHLGKLVNKL